MLLAMDVGNSNIKVGLFEEEKLGRQFSGKLHGGKAAANRTRVQRMDGQVYRM